MQKTTTAIGLIGLLYAISGTAMAQQPLIEHLSVPSPKPNPELQQYIAPPMRADSLAAPDNAPNLNIRKPSGEVAHILPTLPLRAQRQAAIGAADTGPLLYHDNGLVVQHPFIYQIYWQPNALQNGGGTGFSPNYTAVNVALGFAYNGHGIANNNTQYFQIINGQFTFAGNDGFLAGAIVDRDPYPTSGCNNPSTPGNCITDAQLQAELVSVIRAMNWQIGPNNIFMVYTSSGEGSCVASDNKVCSNVNNGYCAYHSSINTNNTVAGVILYINDAYPDPRLCFGNGTSPNNDIFADTAATAASHEVSETITDPLGNAWFTAQGNEIGDLCNEFFDVNTYSNGRANQYWSGFQFELQTEFDNHSGQCVQIGPLYVILQGAPRS